jgi:SGNH hydrolase-like domain, acetyltransferase AlgX
MSTDVHEGHDGWLFLTGTLATLYDRRAGGLPDTKLGEWVKLIETRSSRLEKMGIEYVHMPAPEKLTIYDNKLREPIVDWRLSPALRLGELLRHSRTRTRCWTSWGPFAPRATCGRYSRRPIRIGMLMVLS